MRTIFLLAAITFAFSSAQSAEKPVYSPTAQKIVNDEYHGVKVADPYRWLENTTNEDVVKWTKAQDELARSYLQKLPMRAAIHKQIDTWSRFDAPRYGIYFYRGGKFFGHKRQPPLRQRLIVRLDSLDDLKSEKVVVDPNQLNPAGTTAFDFYEPSFDGSLMAVVLSEGGSEVGTLKFFDVNTGKALADEIPRVQRPTGGGAVAWAKDGKGIYYTRYPAPGERKKEDEDFYQQIYFHKIGQPVEKDTYSLGKDFPRIAEVEFVSSEDGESLAAVVANGDGGEYQHYLLKPDGSWRQLTQYSDRIKDLVFGRHKDLYLLSTKDAPNGQILNLKLDDPKIASAKVVVKESEAVIRNFAATDNKLVVNDLLGGPSQLRVFDLDGIHQEKLALPPVSTVRGLLAGQGDRVFFLNQSYTDPGAVFESVVGKKSKIRKTALVMKSPVSFKDIEVRREFATSKDGTKVPVSILYRKGFKKNGKAPTILTGYGGYGISLSPNFDANLALWLKNGGVYVQANIRGGGEYGEAWHLSGNLTKKQNVFDDFIAAAEHLIKSNYTDSKRLAIMGRSNGGLLMGAALTQRPELFSAIVIGVGVLDMLRVENDANGAFNVTEFGTVKDKAQFNALYAYSPYHNIKSGKPYPAVFLYTGANDGRVNPYHSKKVTARLQSVSVNPVYLRVEYDGGHGMGQSLDQQIEEDTDIYAFLFDRLGMTVKIKP